MSRPKPRRQTGRRQPPSRGARLLLVLLALVAVLVLLLRLAEFSSHRGPRVRRRIAPAALVPLAAPFSLRFRHFS